MSYKEKLLASEVISKTFSGQIMFSKEIKLLGFLMDAQEGLLPSIQKLLRQTNNTQIDETLFQCIRLQDSDTSFCIVSYLEKCITHYYA